MTIILSVLVFIFTSPTFAEESVSSKADKKILELIRQHGYQLLGYMENDKKTPCGLFLTPIGNDLTAIVVGIDSVWMERENELSGNSDDYIGMFSGAVEQLQIEDHRLKFSSKEGWGNNSTFNDVVIEYDNLGRPERAIGKNGIKEIICNFVFDDFLGV